MASHITITVEDETIPFRLYSLVRSTRTAAIAKVRPAPNADLTQERLAHMRVELDHWLQVQHPGYSLYVGGRHLGVMREFDGGRQRAVLIAIED
jgi:hypothetical protein